ncbi:MAG: acetyl-CoA carboxylase biotin carboxyl carrier protein [Acidobacteria bacterium]|nr:acetyl-CoA carboxylase biotin carboxyl carrier protein [Acidobacteriota bacterium]
MDSKELRELMEYLSRSNFAEFEIERDGLKLRLVKESAKAPAAPPQQVFMPFPAPTPSPSPAAPATGAANPAAAATTATAKAGDSGEIYQVTSPMVGTFYRSPNPAAPAYVEVGAVVKKGQAICIVEAMKLMNEIESEVAGEILEIPVANGQPVEYGEVLFRVRLTS